MAATATTPPASGGTEMEEGAAGGPNMIIIAVVVIIILAAAGYYFLSKKAPTPAAKPGAASKPIVPGSGKGAAIASTALGVATNPSFFSGLSSLATNLAKAVGGGSTTPAAKTSTASTVEDACSQYKDNSYVDGCDANGNPIDAAGYQIDPSDGSQITDSDGNPVLGVGVAG